MINKLRKILSFKDKLFFIYLVFFSVIVSLIETVGISLIMPFVAVASDFTVIETNKYYKYFYNIFNFETKINFVIAFGFCLLAFYILRSLINIFYSYAMAKFSYGASCRLSVNLFNKYMKMPYRNFIDKNSGNLTKTITTETLFFALFLQAVLLILSEVFVLISIYSLMLYVNWRVSLALTLIIGLNGLLLMRTISKKIKTSGDDRADFHKKIFEMLNSSFGNFKLIKLKSNIRRISDKFLKINDAFKKANVVHTGLSAVPRLFLEGLGFCMIISITMVVIYKSQANISGILPLISMFILALYRLLPSANRIMTSYNNLMFYNKTFDIIYSEVDQPQEDLKEDDIIFEKEIKLKNIMFGYLQNKLILNKVNLVIRKGEKIAFTGQSGSGKSTLVDIIIGLYKPREGEILADNIKITDNNIAALRKQVGYIPQSIYLFDGTVADNVALGETYDEKRVIDVLTQAKIFDFLQKEQNGIKTQVGENGIKLSGGQKQRIGIARALYSNPAILVLDEATSALDDAMETKIMEEIYDIAENKTLIVIAHRLSTIAKCQKVYKIENCSVELIKSKDKNV
ncbi:MAG: ABC transporter ATP-binding protein [Deltaproteobacteria bacterium]|nr:ABC transporter ATP-binding protein [Deltaproteobacteria bacterium]